MKKTTVILIILFITINAKGQIINSSFYTDKVNARGNHDKEAYKALKRAKRNENREEKQLIRAAENANGQRLDAREKRQTFNDANRRAALESTDPSEISELSRVADSAETESRLADSSVAEAGRIAEMATNTTNNLQTTVNVLSGYIFGTGTVTSLENPTTPNAGLSIGCVIHYLENNFSVAFNPKPAASPDSSNRIKTFLFPEIGSRAFVMQYSRRLFTHDSGNSGINGSFFFNVSVSDIKDTGSKNITITPYNLLAGFRFSIHKDLTKSADSIARKIKNISLSLMPSFSIISIDPKDFAGYDMMFTSTPAKSLPSTLEAVGGRFSFEANSLHIFFDYKYVLNGNSSSFFSSSYWTIGTAVNTQVLFSF